MHRIERRGKRANKKVHPGKPTKAEAQFSPQQAQKASKKGGELMPRVNLFFSQDEYKELKKKASKDHPSVYAYLKDLALKIIKESS